MQFNEHIKLLSYSSMSGPITGAHESAVTCPGLHTDQPRRIPLISGCGNPKNLNTEATCLFLNGDNDSPLGTNLATLWKLSPLL